MHIDKDIPIPDRSDQIANTCWKDTAKEMQIGDSVLVADRAKAHCLVQAINNLYRLSCQEPSCAITRTVEDGIRVWRVA